MKPPYSEEAESAALGAMLFDPMTVVPMAVGRMKVTVDDFFVPMHREVYAAMAAMFAAGKPIDIMTVGQEVRLEDVGFDVMQLDRMVDAMPTAAHAEYYLDTVKQKGILRKILAAAIKIQQETLAAERGDELLKRAPDMIASLADGLVDQRKNDDVLGGIVGKWRTARERRLSGEYVLSGIPTPWRRLNDLTSGLPVGLIFIAGRPAQGKTTMEDCLACHAASEGNTVGRVTLDMNRERLLKRALCRMGGVSMSKLEKGYAGSVNLQAVQDAAELLKTWPMHINDTDREVRAICSWARMLKMKHDLKLLTVDYVQQVAMDVPGKYRDENETITQVSRALKGLAFELNIPVVVVSQMSREAERVERDPKLSDLRGSGSLEQDANIIIFTYKDKKTVDEMPEEVSRRIRPVWVDVQKNQDGETGSIEMWMYAPYFKFEQAEEEWADKDFVVGGKERHERDNEEPVGEVGGVLPL